MAYLGNTPTTQSFISGTDYFNGNGSTTAFTLSRTVASVNDIQAVVNNVVQVPNDAYTISGTTITFTSAPSSGTQNVYVRYLSTTTQAITPSQGTVSWNTLDSNVQGDLGISFKNRIINGAMVIDQRNAGASLSNNGQQQYSVDRWRQNSSQASKFTVQQNAGSVTPPAGFTNYLGFTTTSAVTIASGDYFWFGTTVEGYNSADLNWGTANGKTVTVSFWAYASIVGSYTLLLKPGGGAYSYATSFSLTTANTWQYITVTIPPLTTGGAINTTNGTGIQVNFSLGMGSTYYTSTANTWVSGDFYALNGTVNTISTAGATFYITGVQLEVGTQATTFTTAGGSYGAELALCQRYYQNSYNFGNSTSSTANENVVTTTAWSDGNAPWQGMFVVNMRSAPTVTLRAKGSTTTGQITSNGTARSASADYISNKSVGYIGVTSGTANGYSQYMFELSSEL
jgi:hypothetical protein